MEMENRIKKIRKELDLTQQEFADRIGIKRGAVANYEIGRNIPADSVVSLICREFHVNEEWLRTGEGEMFAPAPTDELDALAMKYDLSQKDYIFIEYLLRNVDARKAMEDFCIGYANAVLEKAEPKKESSAADIDIDAEVADYRRALEEQKKAAGAGSLLSGEKDA